MRARQAPLSACWSLLGAMLAGVTAARAARLPELENTGHVLGTLEQGHGVTVELELTTGDRYAVAVQWLGDEGGPA